MLKVYKLEDTIVTVVVTPKFKEVVVTSNLGTNCYHAEVRENEYGSMGSYVNNWLRAVEGLQPVVVED